MGPSETCSDFFPYGPRDLGSPPPPSMHRPDDSGDSGCPPPPPRKKPKIKASSPKLLFSPKMLGLIPSFFARSEILGLLSSSFLRAPAHYTLCLLPWLKVKREKKDKGKRPPQPLLLRLSVMETLYDRHCTSSSEKKRGTSVEDGERGKGGNSHLAFKSTLSSVLWCEGRRVGKVVGTFSPSTPRRPCGGTDRKLIELR